MKKASLLAFACSFLSIGCIPPQMVFVTRTDIPATPTIVVIPSTDKASEEYGDRVEAAVIKFGVRVVSRPGLKAVTETKEAAKAEKADNANALSAGTAKRTEEFYGWGDTDADLVIQVQASNRRIKVIKRDTREVLASVDDFGSSVKDKNASDKSNSEQGFDTDMEANLYRLLKSLGVPVRAPSSQLKK